MGNHYHYQLNTIRELATTPFYDTMYKVGYKTKPTTYLQTYYWRNFMEEKLQQQIEQENQMRSLWNAIMSSNEDMEVEIPLSTDEFIGFAQRIEKPN